MNSVYTIGHSTHSIEEFLEILHTYRVTSLVDVRSLPGSNRFPHFDKENLKKSLIKELITYEHAPKLGGRRKTSTNSINTGWRNKSFRGYADYMQTKEFADGLSDLIYRSHEQTVVVMCAEAVPWRCHRSLIADALLIRNIEVSDIFSKTNIKPHTLTSWAKVDGYTLTYPEITSTEQPKQ